MIQERSLCLGLLCFLLLGIAGRAEENLVLHLSFDEKEGPVCRDSSGAGNDAQVLDGKRVADETGGALECDGAGTGAVLKASERLRLGKEFTISAWVRLNDEPKGMKGPYPSAVHRFADGAYGFRIGFIRDQNAAFFKWGDGTNPHGYGLPSCRDSWGRGWHHLVGVFAETRSLYVDGDVVEAGGKGGFEERSADLFIGYQGFCGLVDEVAVYTKALSRDDVRALYLSKRAYAGAVNIRSAPAQTKQTGADTSASSRRVNMIPGDGGFESGIDHHWISEGATVDRSTFAHGAACVRLDGCAKGAGLETSDITVDIENSHTFSAFLKGNGPATLSIITVNPNDPYDANWTKSERVQLTNDWQRRSLTLEAGWNWTGQWSGVPRSGHKFRAAIRIGKGSSCWVDSLQFEPGKQPADYLANATAGVSIATGQPGNVYIEGAPVKLQVSLFDPTKAPLSLRHSVRDAEGAVVCEGENPVTLEQTGMGEVSLAPALGERRGFFIVRVDLLRNGVAVAGNEATFCVVAPPRDIGEADSFFGLQLQLSPAWAVAMHRIGVRWFRIGFGWAGIERKKGEFSWETSDERVKLLRDNGIGIMGLIGSTPDWARVAAPKGEWRVHAYPPKDMKDLTDFMAVLAARYRGRVDCWEIWNEPYNAYFSIPPDWKQTKAEVFSDLLKAAYAGAKKGNPDCKVCVNPTGGDKIAKGDEFTNTVLQRAPDAFDIFNSHPYTGRVRIGLDPDVRTPEAFGMVELMRLTGALMREQARGQEVWNSEQGYTLDCDAAPDSTEAMDFAKYMVRSLLLQRAAPIRRGFWFINYDSRVCNNRKGIWRHGLQPLPSVAAYAALARAIDGAKQVRELRPSNDDAVPLQAYAFEQGGGGVVAVWLAEPSRLAPGLVFKAREKMDVTDMMGNKAVDCAMKDGQWIVGLSDRPVYVASEAIAWTELASQVEAGRVVTTPVTIAARVTDAPALRVTVSNVSKTVVDGEVHARVVRQSDGKTVVCDGKFAAIEPGKESVVTMPVDAVLLRGEVAMETEAVVPSRERPARLCQRLRFQPCPRAAGVRVDGRLDDWPEKPGVNECRAASHGERLCLAVRVCEPAGGGLWSGNLLRLGNHLRLKFRACEDGAGWDEFLVGRGAEGIEVYRARSGGGREVGLVPAVVAAAEREGDCMSYEITVPFAEVLPHDTQRPEAIEFQLCVGNGAGEAETPTPSILLLVEKGK